MIMAELDVVLPPAMADRMGDQIGDLEKVLIEGSGHWTQQEKPAEHQGVGVLDPGQPGCRVTHAALDAG